MFMAARASLNILLVEDHFSTRIAMDLWLTQIGHEVTAVETVAAALAVAQKTKIDLIVSDIALPDGDGRELLREIRKHREVPAIAISGNAGPDQKLLSLMAGYAVHFEKPVNLDELTKFLDTVAPNLDV